MSEQEDVAQLPEQVAVPEGTAEGGAGDAWREVLAQLEALGDAVGRWAKAAVNDPDHKRRAAELKEKLDGVGRELGEAADRAAASDVGQSFKEAASKTGEAFKMAGERIGTEVAPKVADALAAAAEKMRQAASRLEDKPGPDDAQAPAEQADPGAPRE